MSIKVRKKGSGDWVFVAGLGRPGKDGSGEGSSIGPAGPQGPKGDTGPQGPPGEDGVSPTVTVTDIPGGHRVTVTDVEGPHSFDVMDGQGGGGGDAGVSSFNGRAGAVIPGSDDYTAEMVGAIPAGEIGKLLVCTQAQYDAAEKEPKTLYLVVEE